MSAIRFLQMPGYPSSLINLDDRDGDWIKRGTWDLPAMNVEELRAWIAAAGMTVADFKRLTAYRANVDRLDWLRDL